MTMTKKQMKQQRLTVQAESPNRRDKKKQKGTEEDEKMNEIEEELTETGQKAVFREPLAEAKLLFRKPEDERWRKLGPQIK
jgi:hypothetical protein